MPVYLWWGEDDYQMEKQIIALKHRVVAEAWQDFNYLHLPATSEAEVITGLAQAVTPVFGMGDRLTWLSNTTICQKSSDTLLKELERTLEHLPANSHLLFTSTSKPDSRLKVTKLLQKYGTMQEFAPIPPWKAEAIATAIKQQATAIGLNLAPPAIDYLVSAVGNDLRRMDMELTKLALCYPEATHTANPKPLNLEQVRELVIATAGNSIQLAQAINHGQIAPALQILAELLRNNEAGLRICATLVGQFRTWTLVKLALNAGHKDDSISRIAELGNPKRVYFLKQEVQHHTAEQWLKTLPILLDLEASLKRGADEKTALTTAIVQLCHCWN